MWDKHRLRALRAIRQDLASRRDGHDLLPEADRLVRFYARAAEREDVLVTEPRAYPRKKDRLRKPRKTKRRKRRLKPTSSDWALAVLREVLEPLTGAQVVERMVAEGRPRLSKQGLSYVLNKLVEEGTVERIEVGGPNRCVWRAVD